MFEPWIPMNFVVCVFIETSCASLWREFIYSCYTRAHDLIDPRFAKIKGNTCQWWLCRLSVFCCGSVLLLQFYFSGQQNTKTTDKHFKTKHFLKQIDKTKKKNNPNSPPQLPPKNHTQHNTTRTHGPALFLGYFLFPKVERCEMHPGILACIRSD